MPTGLSITPSGPAYASIEPKSESTAIEMLDLDGRYQRKAPPATADIEESASLLDSSTRPPGASKQSKLPRRQGLAHYYHRLKQLKGYCFSIICGTVTALVVFVINVVLTLWAIRKSGVKNGISTIQHGSCDDTKHLTVGIHLIINILSTLLLGASNYSMQCLSSPTRGEIDKAHGKGIWLDVGVPSVRNLRSISTRRVVIWWLLALSSIPLHLLYNSAVFSTLSVQKYQVYIVSSDFIDGAAFNIPDSHGEQYPGKNDPLSAISAAQAQATLLGYQQNLSSLSKLENPACINAYRQAIQFNYTDVVLVSSATNAGNSLIDVFFDVGPSSLDQDLDSGTKNSWMCSDPSSSSSCDFSSLADNAQYWNVTCSGLHNPGDLSEEDIIAPIQYCLTPPREGQCKLELSLAIILIVVVCNLVKAICIGFIAWEKNINPLVTVGDAIASFLRHPDPSTEGNCIVGKTEFGHKQEWPRRPSKWTQKATRWYQVVSTRRWIAYIFL